MPAFDPIAACTDTLTLAAANFSQAPVDLGLDVPASGSTITGRDVNAVMPTGIFSHVAALRDALRDNDQQRITMASEGLEEDFDRVVRIRGETGARVQELEARQERLADQNIATQSLLSEIEDTDVTEAITRFHQAACSSGLIKWSVNITRRTPGWLRQASTAAQSASTAGRSVVMAGETAGESAGAADKLTSP